MDFDASISEDCARHDVKSYSFNRLLKFQFETRETYEDASPCSVESLDQFSFCPPVEFPLLKVLDEEMKETFDRMDEVFPPLPCEVGSRKVSLGKLKAGANGVLVIEADGLLTKVSKKKEVVWHSYSKELLRQLERMFEIVLVFNCGNGVTNKLMDKLDKKQELVAKVLGTESTIKREIHTLIDLRIFEDRNPSQIVVVTSSLMNLTGWLENGIYLEPNEKIEEKLMATREFLLSLPKVDDIRPLVKKFSGLIRIFKIYVREKLRSCAQKQLLNYY
eukprot:TRINITY_DN4586_c0_g1_i6.p1 TRINITY_DN4586_c0_g1~~TRINITY_DN4586_c0_g1_i6.p1  ORF type:complete len:276 (+),score=46.04 TRINITY_DN4586_c0_g1_i6:262-1089(+)